MSKRFSETIDISNQYVIIGLHGDLFGLPVATVQDVIHTPNMTRVPLASNEVVGLLNLRGRIVTAIDLGVKLGVAPAYTDKKTMSVILEIGSEFYSLIVNEVGEVKEFDDRSRYEKNPNALDPRWRPFASGIYQLDKELIVLLDEKKIFSDLIKG
jgi:purine-binding chemotaxis protein CheW